MEIASRSPWHTTQQRTGGRGSVRAVCELRVFELQVKSQVNRRARLRPSRIPTTPCH